MTQAMSGMRAHLASRLRSSSFTLSAVPPRESTEYNADLARAAASILYRTPIPSKENRPIYILNAAALPDSKEADFDALLPYVLARLPEEDDLLRGSEYEVVFFAGDSDGSATNKKTRPGWGWFLQAYHVLSRAMRKRLQKLYIVHEKAWVRILTEVFSTIVSPKFRRKIYHASTLSNLALHIPIEDLLIPPSTYLYDRRVSDDIYAPYASGRRAFAARQPFPSSTKGKSRFPRVLRETTSFLLLDQNIGAEGLFRVPAHAKLRDVLKEAYDRGQKYIIYKDNEATLPVLLYLRAEHQDEVINEVDPKDAYSVFMAAALIKAWYADLRQPIFPPSTYRDLKRLFGDAQNPPDLQRLIDLFSPSSEWSFLPSISREIVTRHLLPLLSSVAAHQEQNKMTAENLAVCFAPVLLCGPDQLEDAKMSSVIRRVFTKAVELWTNGLRDACGVDAGAFEEDLRLPEDPADWDDPVEGNKYGLEASSIDEDQVTGIILQDNTEEAPISPPPLPPRSTISQPGSVSGRSSNDSVRRKPAPPLQVPPRYSVVVSDSPVDAGESPATYAAVTDGFAPPRSAQWDHADEKTTGTNSIGDSHVPPIKLPKRKALTAQQIDNAEFAIAQLEALKVYEGRVGLPGLASPDAKDRRLFQNPSEVSDEGSCHSFSGPSSPAVVLPVDSAPAPAYTTEFRRRPSLPASTNRTPSIASLARPIHPSATAGNRPASKSTSLPIPGPKPRTPSPALLQRMPSFGSSKTPPSLGPPTQPRKLNLKKASVDDLRRLYEERAGTAKTLVEAGKPQ